jgi:hypothetical protein
LRSEFPDLKYCKTEFGTQAYQCSIPGKKEHITVRFHPINEAYDEEKHKNFPHLEPLVVN